MADFSVREAYLRFASREARGVSACYQQWAEGVASDAGLVARISQLTGIKRQPQLIFAAARLLGAPAAPFPVFREWLLEHWDQVRAEALSRRRCPVAARAYLARARRPPSGTLDLLRRAVRPVLR